MPGKIANTLSTEQLAAMLADLRALSGEPTYAQIQKVAAKYGVKISIEGAKTFKKKTWDQHLAMLASGREKAERVMAAVRGGAADPLDAVEASAASDLLDLYTSGEAEIDVGDIVKIALQLRASIEQRKDRDRADADLARKVADSDAKRAGDAQRISFLEKRLELAQLDAAAAVLTHAAEIRLVIADKSLDGPAKTERVRKILFGEKPADFKPITTKGAQAE